MCAKFINLIKSDDKNDDDDDGDRLNILFSKNSSNCQLLLIMIRKMLKYELRSLISFDNNLL